MEMTFWRAFHICWNMCTFVWFPDPYILDNCNVILSLVSSKDMYNSFIQSAAYLLLYTNLAHTCEALMHHMFSKNYVAMAHICLSKVEFS